MVWVPCVCEIWVPYLMRTLWILVSTLYVVSILAFSLLSIVSCYGQKTLVLTYLFAFTFAATLFSGTKTYCSPQCQNTSFPCPDFSLNTSTHSDFIVLSIRPRFRFTLRGNHILYSNCSNSYSVIAACPLSSVSAQAARFSRKMAIHPPPHPVSSLLFHSSPFSSCSHLTDVWKPDQTVLCGRSFCESL